MDQDTAAAILRELQHISYLLQELPARLSVSSSAKKRAIKPADKLVLDALLPAIQEVMGSSSFTQDELEEEAKTYDVLRLALETVRANGITPQKLGCLFRRVKGKDLGGNTVLWCCNEETRSGQRWQVVTVRI